MILALQSRADAIAQDRAGVYAHGAEREFGWQASVAGAAAGYSHGGSAGGTAGGSCCRSSLLSLCCSKGRRGLRRDSQAL
ncbi:MAG: hypothetical protein ACI835_005786, partial [Planctomycetota bacterium]